ncbi:MAG: nicotinamide-nucleotide amidohydrolase family protein [Planctomycetes bacterium]|nr:nicotinamide-nucleotide amidohydrolase family protein [Planctomycetota bacterium]
MPDAAPHGAPRARILLIGDELLLGRTADANGAWLARRLSDAGFLVRGLHIVGDEEREIVAALRAARRDAELVVCSGGLGPTADDRTRQALARLLRAPLIEDGASWRRIQRWHARRRPGTEVPASNRQQALLPRGAEALLNDRGTAPGILARGGGAWIACLPGVPHELQAMSERLLRRLRRLLPGWRRPACSELWVAGISESALQDRLGELLAGDEPRVGITVSEQAYITLRLVGAPAAVRARRRALRARLGPWLLPAPSLAASLVQALRAAGATVACAESCTAGHAAASLLAVPGASAVLRESLIAYHEEAKIARLGVARALIREQGVVSEPVVRAMAEGLRRAVGCDLALATTGIAGPTGGTPQLPVGTVWVAAASARGTVARRLLIAGERQRVQRRAAAEALLLAWQHWRSGGSPPPA